MITNNEFGLIIRKNETIKGTASTYINILNSFDNNENIVEINGSKYDLTKKHIKELKKLVEKNLNDLIKISKEQTQTYLNKNGLDGYGKSVTILLGGMQIYVNFAVADKKVKDLGNLLLEKIEKVIIG